MPRSNQTKQLLAQSLQELMATTPLEKISVNDIVFQKIGLQRLFQLECPAGGAGGLFSGKQGVLLQCPCL